VGATILARSRIIMSHALIAAHGYLVPRYALRYTDTDSLILHVAACRLLPADFYHEKLLGKFKDDLKGEGRIIRAVFLAPKSYCLMYRTKDNLLWLKVRCKGIPHQGDPIPLDESTALITAHDDALHAKALAILNRGVTGLMPRVDPKFRAYIITHLNGQVRTTPHLTYECFRMLLENQVQKIQCLYGTFKVQYAAGSDVSLTIQPRYQERTLGEFQGGWWTKGKRISTEHEIMTQPLGFRI